MFAWAIAGGIYTYYLLFLGIVGWLEFPYILIGTSIFGLYTYWQLLQAKLWQQLKVFLPTLTKFEKILLSLIALQAAVNLIGTLGPEISYDAVWYHLTIPRIWLLEDKIFYIPNGPFSYSLLPKTLDLWYLAGLMLSNEATAKVIHWTFGILCGLVIYKIAKHFYKRKYAVLAVVVFFSNLVVGWQSITAYIDLGRTFFEALALLALIKTISYSEKRWVYWIGVMLGLAIMTKLIAVTSLAAVACIFILKRKPKAALLISCLAMLIPLPWFVLNYMQTGNPIHPVLSGYSLESDAQLLDVITIWLHSADPLSPLYFMLAPLGIWALLPVGKKYFKSLERSQKNTFYVFVGYCILTFIFWALTPRTGGGRFILPYLPAYSILLIYPVSRLKDRVVHTAALTAIILVSLFSSLYRLQANQKYLPVLVSKQTKDEFLLNQLPENFGHNWFYLTDESLKAVYKSKNDPTSLEWSYTSTD